MITLRGFYRNIRTRLSLCVMSVWAQGFKAIENQQKTARGHTILPFHIWYLSCLNSNIKTETLLEEFLVF